MPLFISGRYCLLLGKTVQGHSLSLNIPYLGPALFRLGCKLLRGIGWEQFADQWTIRS